MRGSNAAITGMSHWFYHDTGERATIWYTWCCVPAGPLSNTWMGLTDDRLERTCHVTCLRCLSYGHPLTYQTNAALRWEMGRRRLVLTP